MYFYLVGLPDLKAWGKKRSKFYGADISDDDIGKKAVKNLNINLLNRLARGSFSPLSLLMQPVLQFLNLNIENV